MSFNILGSKINNVNEMFMSSVNKVLLQSWKHVTKYEMNNNSKNLLYSFSVANVHDSSFFLLLFLFQLNIKWWMLMRWILSLTFSFICYIYINKHQYIHQWHVTNRMFCSISLHFMSQFRFTHEWIVKKCHLIIIYIQVALTSFHQYFLLHWSLL